jgi:hypothetical protein
VIKVSRADDLQLASARLPLERALVAALAPAGIGKLDYGNLVVNGLIGWGGLAARARLADRGITLRIGQNRR